MFRQKDIDGFMSLYFNVKLLHIMAGGSTLLLSVHSGSLSYDTQHIHSFNLFK